LYFYDINGRVVFSKKDVSSYDKSISLENLSSDTYVYKAVFHDGTMQTGKIIKK